MLKADQLRLVDYLHGGFPVVDRPFAAVAAAMGWSEEYVIECLRQLLASGVLTRFGPLFQIERAGGQFMLAALAVPEDRFDEVTALVNALPEVAHNYRRDHPVLNMWFVLAADSAQGVADAARHIEEITGLTVFQFPKEREFHVELRLPLVAANGAASAA